MGKQRKLEGNYFGISETKLLRFYCVHQLSLQGQCRAQLKLIYEAQTHRISSCPVIPDISGNPYLQDTHVVWTLISILI